MTILVAYPASSPASAAASSSWKPDVTETDAAKTGTSVHGSLRR